MNRQSNIPLLGYDIASMPEEFKRKFLEGVAIATERYSSTSEINAFIKGMFDAYSLIKESQCPNKSSSSVDSPDLEKPPWSLN